MVTAAVVETQKNSKLKDSLKLIFKFDSMTVVLYKPTGDEVVYHSHPCTYTQIHMHTHLVDGVGQFNLQLCPVY